MQTLSPKVRPDLPPRDFFHPSSGAATAYLCIALVLIVGFVFSPLLTVPSIHPDDRAFRAEMTQRSESYKNDAQAAFERVHFPPGTGGYYQPITALSIMMDNRLAGFSQQRTFQYHLTNIVLHAVNVVLVFLVLRGLSRRLLLSAALALVFGLHPLAVESVASVAHRMTLLGGLFSLGAILCYLSYATTRRGMIWLILATLFYAAAALSKPTFIALPVLLLVLDFWPLRRATSRVVVEKVPLFFLAAAFAVVHFLMRVQISPVRAVEVGGVEMLVRTVGGFIYRTLWPMSLACSYPVGAAGQVNQWPLVVVGITLAMLTAGWMISVRLSRPLFVLGAGAIALVGPAIVNVPYSATLLGDTYLYLAMLVPLIVVASWLKAEGDRRRNGAAALVAIAIAMVLGVRSFTDGFNWQSGRELYQHVVDLYPKWPPGRVKLVEACISENELDAALVQAEAAARLNPGDASTQFYLGTTLLLLGESRSVEAIEPLRAALSSNTGWIECLQNLGVALARSGKLPEAIEHLEKARDLSPDCVGIRIGLGNAYLHSHRAASARREFQEALRLRSDPDIHLGLAVAWAANDVPELARKHLAAAVAGDSRMASKAARYPELLRLRNEAGFAELIDISTHAQTAARHADLETATSEHGS